MYTEKVSQILEKLFREFKETYPELACKKDLRDHIDSFIENRQFVETYNDIAEFILDYNIRLSAEIKMQENTYDTLIDLFNDAFRYEAWDYLCSNYVVQELDEEWPPIKYSPIVVLVQVPSNDLRIANRTNY